MQSSFAEKDTKSQTKAAANQKDGVFGKKLAAVPALQKKDAEEELPLQGKFTVQKKDGPEEEEPAQMKGGSEEEEPLQMKGGPEEEEEPLQMKGPEEEEPLQMKGGPEEEEPAQGKFVVQKKANNTGLPDNLKSGVENLSGMDMSDVKVHYNSSQPAQLNALAYAQGTDIHVAPGQEKHLPHEAWHVVQQKQGRVQATRQMKDSVPVNDDKGLETEADVMGAKAIQMKSADSHGKSCCCSSCTTTQLKKDTKNANATIQRMANVSINAPITSVPAAGIVAQLTDASVFVNGSNRGNGHCDMGEGTGGEDHAEQLAWDNAKDNIDNRFATEGVNNVAVSFEVDQKICSLCQDWFETTIFDYLTTKSNEHNKTFELWVEVNHVRIQVHGSGETNWPKTVGDEERIALIDELKNILTETGGLGENKITVFDNHGDTTDYEYYGEEHLETVLREHEGEIKASKQNWENFQETGMVLRGNRGNIDFDDVEAEKSEGTKGMY